MTQGITPKGKRFAFVHADSEKAKSAQRRLIKLYGQNSAQKADIIVAIGGDGFLLETLNRYSASGKPVFGMNRGTVGFLLNTYELKDLPERLDNAVAIKLYRLALSAITTDGQTIRAKAINEVSLFRQSAQSAQLSITVDGNNRLPCLVCDGILLSTPAGSTAYNLSAHGPIIPLEAHLMALTPISAFRPRRWTGALLERNAKVIIDVLDTAKRPVSAAADGLEIRDVIKVSIETDRRVALKLLFDPDLQLQERIIKEQFLID
ncbi:MAG: NAD+ kinase [Pseudomonadales bacterium]|jgi:NAD+ kinase